MSIKVYLMAILDNYTFRPLLAISHWHYHASSQSILPHIEITVRNKARM